MALRPIMQGGRLVAFKDEAGNTVARVPTLADALFAVWRPDGSIKLSGGTPEGLAELAKATSTAPVKVAVPPPEAPQRSRKGRARKAK